MRAVYGRERASSRVYCRAKNHGERQVFMSIHDVRVAPLAPPDLPIQVIPQLIIAAGILVSLSLGALGLLQGCGVYETEIGYVIADTYMNGEHNWDASRDHHGQWGDTLFIILGMPFFLSVILVACITPLVQTNA